MNANFLLLVAAFFVLLILSFLAEVVGQGISSALLKGIQALVAKIYGRRSKRNSTSDDEEATQEASRTTQASGRTVKWNYVKPKRAKTIEVSSGSSKRLRNAVVAGVILSVIAATGLALLLGQSIRQHRIDRTRKHIEELADSFATQITKEEVADLPTGPLAERDAWQQPIELHIDDSRGRTSILVRSAGPDRTPGTVDDLFAERTVQTPTKKPGAGIVDRAVQGIRDRVKRLLNSDDEDETHPEPE